MSNKLLIKLIIKNCSLIKMNVYVYRLILMSVGMCVQNKSKTIIFIHN